MMSLANFMQPLDLPKDVERWSLTTPRKKPVKSGAKVVSHERYVNFQMAEVAVPRELFRKTLRLIDGLRPRPSPASAGSEAKSTGAVCLDEGKMEEIGLMWGDTPPNSGNLADDDASWPPMAMLRGHDDRRFGRYPGNAGSTHFQQRSGHPHRRSRSRVSLQRNKV